MEVFSLNLSFKETSTATYGRPKKKWVVIEVSFALKE